MAGGKRNDFRRVVGMAGEDHFFQRSQSCAGRFEEQKNLGAAIDLSPPPEVGFDFWHEVGAGGEAGPQSCPRELAGGLQIGSRDENQFVFSRGSHGHQTKPPMHGEQDFSSPGLTPSVRAAKISPGVRAASR